MKKMLWMAFFGCALTTLAFAQADKPKPSPAQTTKGKIGDVDVAIKYNAPSVKGRTVWGELVPYDKVWRTGANEATTISFDKDVMVEGQKLPAGTYAFFTIPGEKEWTLIFNRETEQWGAYKYDDSQDALRVKVKPQMAKQTEEQMKFAVKESGKNTGQVMLMWEKMTVPFTVKKG